MIQKNDYWRAMVQASSSIWVTNAGVVRITRVSKDLMDARGMGRRKSQRGHSRQE